MKKHITLLRTFQKNTLPFVIYFKTYLHLCIPDWTFLWDNKKPFILIYWDWMAGIIFQNEKLLQNSCTALLALYVSKKRCKFSACHVDTRSYEKSVSFYKCANDSRAEPWKSAFICTRSQMHKEITFVKSFQFVEFFFRVHKIYER